MSKLKKNALITGAGSGIGAEISITLAKQYHTIITGKSLSSLKKTEKQIVENGGSCTLVELDMNNYDGIDKLGLEIFKRWKSPEGFIIINWSISIMWHGKFSFRCLDFRLRLRK